MTVMRRYNNYIFGFIAFLLLIVGAGCSDPDKTGINFLINPNSRPVALTGNVDPATGLPEAAATELLDVGAVVIKFNQTLRNVTMKDLLDAIVMVADHPIKYSVLDYGIVFASKGAQTPQLYMRTFKVDPNTFYSGLESVSSSSFGLMPSIPLTAALVISSSVFSRFVPSSNEK